MRGKVSVYDLKFQASTGGFGATPPQIRKTDRKSFAEICVQDCASTTSIIKAKLWK